MKKFLSSYTAKLIYIFITAALLSTTIFLGIKLHSINKQQQEEISAIRQALEQLETYADNNEFDEDGKPYIHIELEQPKTNFESAESLTDVLNIVQNQNMQSSQDISNYITVFSIIISVVVLAIPIFNYRFLQKDQVERLNKQYETFSERFEKELERMEKTIEQSSEVTEALANPESDDVDISPISDSIKDRARALYIQGRLSINKKRYEQGILLLNEAIDLEPDNARYYNLRGMAFYNLKRYEEALENKNKALELDNSDEFKCYKGITFARLKRYKEAIDILNDVSGCGEKSYYYRYRGLVKLGLAQSEEVPIPNEVWVDFNKAIELEPQDYKNYRYKAEAYLMIGEPEQAKPLLDKVNELKPKEPNTHHLFALYYEQMGDSEKAKEYHELADGYGYIPEPEIEEEECD